MAIFTGSGVALVTPFHEDESINYDKLDEMLEYIQIYAASVESPDEKDRKSQKALELYKYLDNNREGLLPYDRRGIRIAEPPEGMIYKGMGVQESQNCTVITLRMKHRRMRWSCLLYTSPSPRD